MGLGVNSAMPNCRLNYTVPKPVAQHFIHRPFMTRALGINRQQLQDAEGETLCSNAYCLRRLSQLASRRFLRLLKHRHRRQNHLPRLLPLPPPSHRRPDP
jgi:hypothetical protein